MPCLPWHTLHMTLRDPGTEYPDVLCISIEPGSCRWTGFLSELAAHLELCMSTIQHAIPPTWPMHAPAKAPHVTARCVGDRGICKCELLHEEPPRGVRSRSLAVRTRPHKKSPSATPKRQLACVDSVAGLGCTKRRRRFISTCTSASREHSKIERDAVWDEEARVSADSIDDSRADSPTPETVSDHLEIVDKLRLTSVVALCYVSR
ncbi:hypothetical protein C8R44DRAFT_730758 [Mycena epipterygia]|nr:hypothetical protein C8R44DRAFT_730758 [Mycena epipterygia]